MYLNYYKLVLEICPPGDTCLSIQVLVLSNHQRKSYNLLSSQVHTSPRLSRIYTSLGVGSSNLGVPLLSVSAYVFLRSRLVPTSEPYPFCNRPLAIVLARLNLSVDFWAYHWPVGGPLWNRSKGRKKHSFVSLWLTVSESISGHKSATECIRLYCRIRRHSIEKVSRRDIDFGCNSKSRVIYG